MAEPDQPTNPARAHFQRASALLNADRLAEAEREVRSALALAPQAAPAATLLAIILGRTGRGAEAVPLLRSALARWPDFAPALYNLGLALRGQHRHADALACFEKLAAVDPDNTMARNMVGASLVELGRTEEAIAALEEAVRRDPANTTLKHMLAALKGERTDAPPADFVRGLFDEYAASFENHLVMSLGYAIPATLRRMVGGLGQRRFARALDLGCGTGMVGAAFADVVATMVGVDLSPNMVREAKKKNVYAALHAQSFDDFFGALPVLAAPFELVIAADVFVYVGRLDALFAEVARRMARGGLFGFSVEGLSEGDFALQPTGRYAHSGAYIERLAAAHGFAVAARQAATIRKGYPGEVFVLRRG